MAKRSIGLTLALGWLVCTSWPVTARADKLSWTDNVLRGIVRQAREEAGAAAKPIDKALLRSTSDLDTLARSTDEWARVGTRSVEAGAEEARFAKLVKGDASAIRGFQDLTIAEKRLVTRMGEASQSLARRYPADADDLIRRLGPEGLTAVRVYGDDVAQVIAREGPEAIDVLRKSGRPGWKFYSEVVLRHKGKLAAAGVLTAFLANPDDFVDSAGKVTQYAIEQFAKAGIDLAGAVGTGASKGLENAVGAWLSRHGIDSSPARMVGMVLVGGVAIACLLVLIGVPFRTMTRPFVWPFRLLRRRFGS